MTIVPEMADQSRVDRILRDLTTRLERLGEDERVHLTVREVRALIFKLYSPAEAALGVVSWAMNGEPELGGGKKRSKR